jgi:hypothetical protein
MRQLLQGTVERPSRRGLFNDDLGTSFSLMKQQVSLHVCNLSVPRSWALCLFVLFMVLLTASSSN